jgi:hypothetical protein
MSKTPLIEQFVLRHHGATQEYVVIDHNYPEDAAIAERYFMSRLRSLLDVDRRADQEIAQLNLRRERIL